MLEEDSLVERSYLLMFFAFSLFHFPQTQYISEAVKRRASFIGFEQYQEECFCTGYGSICCIFVLEDLKITAIVLGSKVSDDFLPNE